MTSTLRRSSPKKRACGLPAACNSSMSCEDCAGSAQHAECRRHAQPLCSQGAVRITFRAGVAVEDQRVALRGFEPGPVWNARMVRIAGPGEGQNRVGQCIAHAIGIARAAAQYRVALIVHRCGHIHGVRRAELAVEGGAVPLP